MARYVFKMCSICGRPLKVIFDGFYISGGHYLGEHEDATGVVEEWACGECIFYEDYENT
jgi:hypothetical protein